jgi:hypothetical protein
VRHFARILAVAGAVVVSAVPAIVVDPAVVSLVANHPWFAAYLPAISGVVYALYRAWRNRRASTTQVPSSGAPTMGAN